MDGLKEGPCIKMKRTQVKVAPTNQSDSGWRAEMSWQVNNRDGEMA